MDSSQLVPALPSQAAYATSNDALDNAGSPPLGDQKSLTQQPHNN